MGVAPHKQLLTRMHVVDRTSELTKPPPDSMVGAKLVEMCQIGSGSQLETASYVVGGA